MMSNRSLALSVVVVGLIACSCSSGPGDGSSSPDAGASTIDGSATLKESGDDNSVDDAVEEAAPDTAAPAETDPDDTAGESERDSSGEFGPADFQSLGPAAGDPIVIGMVNTEGTPGLDFPEMRTDTDLAVTYLNEHGGMGGRPVQIEHCAAAGSPETSQACAQELSGKGVDFVMLGLDLFPGYETFAASGIPVFGALPILPPDYTAEALFLTGGNATTMAAIAALAVEHYRASTVGVISADSAGGNSSEAALTGALDKAGLSYVSIKGGAVETDAGFQGLIREANSDEPDVLVSLYDDAGCIGAVRGRVLLGIDTPMISTAICGSADVIDVVGDDAIGWNYVGVGSPAGTPASEAFAELLQPEYGEASSTSLGLGALGIGQMMTLARVANAVAAEGGEVTGQAIYDRLSTSTDLQNFPNDNVLSCGLSESYPSVCSFQFPIGEYLAGGEIQTVPGFEAISVVDYLP
ncbi:ABC transporter substrate-binding protein [uncultured Ilumatobacter sp.]|uniref:ABC transporter substrate-binding protein n=1 Tax=uncultured Ilumatobacter sp. TaxID=879968 RepID=UPI00374FD3FF